MANYATLKAAIADVVKTNGSQAITGANLQQVLFSIVNSIGTDYLFAGVATPSTSVGTPDQNVFYLTGAGTFGNMGSTVTIPTGSIGIFKYNGSWSSNVLNLFDGVDNVPTAGSDNLLKSGGAYDYIREQVFYLSKGLYIDIGHYVKGSSGVYSYAASATYSCAWIDLNMALAKKISLTGCVITRYRFFNSYDITTESYVSDNTTGIIPATAVVCLVNLKTSENPNGYGNAHVDYIRDVDAVPTNGSDNLVTSGGVYTASTEAILSIGFYDASASNGGAEYASLSAALAAVPSSSQKGGMTVKFINSVTGEYEQYRLMASSWSTETSDWQGMDAEPTPDSENIVTSGGVAETLGYAVENPEFMQVITDKEGHILEGIDKNGKKALPNGYYIGDMQQIVISNPQFSEVKIDSDGRIVTAIGKDGTLHLSIGFGINGNGVTTIPNPQYKSLIMDDAGHILWAVENNGNIIYGAGVPKQITEYIDSALGDMIDDISKTSALCTTEAQEKDFIMNAEQEWAIDRLIGNVLATLEDGLYNDFIARLEELNNGRRLLNLALIADTHQGGTRVLLRVVESSRAIAMWNRLLDSELIDAGVHCGDMSTDYGMNNEMYCNLMRYVKSIMYHGEKPWYAAKGNHDSNNQLYENVDITRKLDWEKNRYYVVRLDDQNYPRRYVRVTEDTWDQAEPLYIKPVITPAHYVKDSLFAKMFQGSKPSGSVVDTSNKFGGYFYYDYDDYKVRVIVLNNFPVDDAGNYLPASYIATQLNWFANEALDLTDKDTPSDWQVVTIGHDAISKDEGAYELTWKIINAFQSGDSIDENYGGANITHDYTEQGGITFIANLHGHFHMNSALSPSSGKGFWDIAFDDTMTTGAEFNTNEAYRVHVVSIDTIGRKLYDRMVAGSAYDRSFDY